MSYGDGVCRCGLAARLAFGRALAGCCFLAARRLRPGGGFPGLHLTELLRKLECHGYFVRWLWLEFGIGWMIAV